MLSVFCLNIKSLKFERSESEDLSKISKALIEEIHEFDVGVCRIEVIHEGFVFFCFEIAVNLSVRSET